MESSKQTLTVEELKNFLAEKGILPPPPEKVASNEGEPSTKIKSRDYVLTTLLCLTFLTLGLCIGEFFPFKKTSSSPISFEQTLFPVIDELSQLRQEVLDLKSALRETRRVPMEPAPEESYPSDDEIIEPLESSKDFASLAAWVSTGA